MQRIVTEVMHLPKAPDWSFYVRRGLFGRRELVLCWREAGRSEPDGHGAHRQIIYAYDDRRLGDRIAELLATDDPTTLLDPRAFADETPASRDETP